MKLLLVFLSGILILLSQGCPSSDGNGNNGESALEITGHNLGTLIINHAGAIVYVEIENKSSSPVHDLYVFEPSYPLSFAGGSFPGKGGTCADSIDAHHSCRIALQVASWAIEGAFSQELRYRFSVMGNHYQKAVDLQAEFKDLVTLITQNLDFGKVAVGSRKTLQLRLKNPSSFATFRNLSLQLGQGTQFSINNPSHCTTIPPLSSCDLDIEFAPTSGAMLSETAQISYEALGAKLSETISIDANVDAYLSTNGTNSFGALITEYNKPGTITLTLQRDPSNTLDVKNIVLATDLTGTPLQLDRAASTCLNPGMTLTAANNCTLVFTTRAIIKATTAINQNIDLTFQVGLTNKQFTLTLNGSLRIDPLNLHAGSNHNFGTAYVVQGGTMQAWIRVENPLSSSIPQAISFSLTNKKGSNILNSKKGGGLPITLAAAQTTCTAATTLTRGQDCVFVLEMQPAVNINNFSKDLVVNYKVGPDNLTIPVPINGNLHVVNLGTGSPGSNIIQVTGHANFGPMNASQGSSFDVPVTVTNTSVSDIVLNFVIDPYDPLSLSIRSWFKYFMQISPVKSTCMTGGPLAAGATCTLVFEITPDPTKQTNLGGGRRFRVSYVDGGNHKHSTDITLSGTWNFVAQGASAAWPENTLPPKAQDIISSVNLADPWYGYQKRPVKNVVLTPQQQTAFPQTYGLPQMLFPQWAWNNIPAMTFHHDNHMVWTFRSIPDDSIVKLKDIVPDRIIDPVTNKSYVMLYHGSTSDVLAHSFTNGSSSIAFDKAVNTAYGQGFYMASNANESKEYACSRQAGKPSHIHSILLIIGVQEDDAIKGARDPINAAGDAHGNPRNPTIFFQRTSTSNNQFLFYSNIKPYLRIFKIIKLGSGHRKSVGLDDGDGTPLGPLPAWKTDPATNLNYTCNY